MITLHTFVSETGNIIEFARIRRSKGQTTVGQSVLLNRLSELQLRELRRKPNFELLSKMQL